MTTPVTIREQKDAKFEKLKAKLGELFQMDQAELDFGIYRIMNQKRDRIEEFLENDLLPQVREALSGVENADAVEGEVYDHLLTFFSRYYEEGDFISQRRYGREGKYAIPYNGEEVKLHWANHDQYYIKSSERLKNYAFTVEKDGKKRRVQFEIVKAVPVKDNNKADRYYVVSENEPARVENGDLVVQFEHRAIEPKEVGMKSQRGVNVDRVNSISIDRLENWRGYNEWKEALEQPRPTEANEKRTLLEKHLAGFAKRYTFDYFIHKDLGGFLQRELDFYIKNEVFRLDDVVEQKDTTLVEGSLEKVRALRRVADKIISFLAQLEKFQKKLWLKKKFVLETNYCVTLDRVPEDLYSEILDNKKQLEQWINLFHINDIFDDAISYNFSGEINEQFLRSNQNLVVDTANFDDEFTSRLLRILDDIDEQCSGVLMQSENSQALNLLKKRHGNEIKCTYIDPPYNTGSDGFIYKDRYKHSTWITMFQNRLQQAKTMLTESGVLFFSIDANEAPFAWLAGLATFGEDNFASEMIWEKKKKPSFLHRNIGKVTDFVLGYTRDSSKSPAFSVETTTRGKKTPLNNAGNSLGVLRFPAGRVNFGFDNGKIEPQDMSNGRIITQLLDPVTVKDGYNINEFRLKGEFRYSQDKLNEVCNGEDKLYISQVPFRPNHVKPGGEPKKMKNMLSRNHYEMETNEDASAQLRDLFGSDVFPTPKPEKLVRYLVKSVTYEDDTAKILDYFAGSGTTGHSIINLNRQDGGNRKYILVEMGEYFDTVLLPRIQKAVFAEEWKNGVPQFNEKGELGGGSHMFKYQRLESYEDTLNNLNPPAPTNDKQRTLDQHQQDALKRAGEDVREEYMLSYMLDVETEGSASLLDLDAFSDPFNYKLKIIRNDEIRWQNVDLIETFNYLIGLRLETYKVDDGVTWITGMMRSAVSDEPRKVIVLWRNLDEVDNDALDDWFEKHVLDTGLDFDVVYVNGDCNLAALRGNAKWQVCLTEEEFQERMFDTSNAI